MVSTPNMGAINWGDHQKQEFCNIICEAPAVQVQAHGYALEYVEKLSLGAAQDKCVCVGDTLEQKDGNYPPGIKRGKLGKSIINGGLFYPENQLEIGSCGNCPLPRLMTRGYLLTNLENHPRIPPLVAVLSSGGCQYE
jgi:hypothetical protein